MMRVLSVIGILFLGGAFFTSCITSGILLCGFAIQQPEAAVYG